MIKKTVVSTAVFAACMMTSVVQADDFTDTLKEAISAYEAGDFTMARENVTYASQLLREKAAEQLAAVLPDALSGWTAQDVDMDSGAAALFGGGLQASRSYARDGKSVEISIMGDSPMLAQFMMLMGNPALAGSMGKMVRIGKHRGIQSKDENKISLVFNNRFMITVEGSADSKDLLAYAEAIDFDALEQL